MAKLTKIGVRKIKFLSKQHSSQNWQIIFYDSTQLNTLDIYIYISINTGSNESIFMAVINCIPFTSN